MSSNLKSIIFATLLCVVCSVLLTAASSGLKVFHQKNLRIDKQLNILKSVGLIRPETTYSSSVIDGMYTRSIQALWTNSEGRIIKENERTENDLPIYLFIKDKTIEAYIVPVNSRGLWGKIHGYLAIKSDGKTISGFSVYKHSETPGLGGEIEKRWFQQNFIGKKIVDQDGRFVSISIAKGAIQDKLSKEQQTNYVDGISGATLTGKFLTSGLKKILRGYEPVSIRFRKNKVNKKYRSKQDDLRQPQRVSE